MLVKIILCIPVIALGIGVYSLACLINSYFDNND